MTQHLRYPCLILDHDDTVVDSTAHLHYPAFLSSIEILRPGITMTLDEYFDMNCDPGIFAYYTDVVHLSEEELDFETKHWLNYVKTHIPTVYPGMREVIETQRALGGKVCVVSHSAIHNILRDYEKNGLPAPDMVFGLEGPAEQRKPAPWPVKEILRRFGFAPEEAIVVDDLKPGYDMAKAAGVAFAPACWAHHAPLPRRFMTEHCERLFFSPAELRHFLFDDENGL